MQMCGFVTATNNMKTFRANIVSIRHPYVLATVLRCRKCRNRKRRAFGEFSNYFLNRFPDEFCVGDKPKEIWLAAKLKFKEWNVARYESRLPQSLCFQIFIYLNGSCLVFNLVLFMKILQFMSGPK